MLRRSFFSASIVCFVSVLFIAASRSFCSVNATQLISKQEVNLGKKERMRDLRAGRAVSWFSLLYLTMSATLRTGHSSNDWMNFGMQTFLKSQSFK